jgi:hypothetical protein
MIHEGHGEHQGSEGVLGVTRLISKDDLCVVLGGGHRGPPGAWSGSSRGSPPGEALEMALQGRGIPFEAEKGTVRRSTKCLRTRAKRTFVGLGVLRGCPPCLSPFYPSAPATRPLAPMPPSPSPAPTTTDTAVIPPHGETLSPGNRCNRRIAPRSSRVIRRRDDRRGAKLTAQGQSILIQADRWGSNPLIRPQRAGQSGARFGLPMNRILPRPEGTCPVAARRE